MKIISLYSENFKRLKAVQITPQGNVIYISGQNGEGKSSVLDAIWSTLQHRATTKRIPEPVRGGEAQAKNVIDLGQYIVTRTYSASGNTELKIETPDNSIIKSPQRLLDGLVGDLSFDPWEFIRQDETKQRETLGALLYRITNGKCDLHEFDRRYKEAYDKRTDLNKEKKRLGGTVSAILPPTGTDPIAERSVIDLTARLSDAIELNRNNEELALLMARVNVLEQRNVQLTSGLIPLDEVAIRNELQNIEKINKRAREVSIYNRTKQDLDDAQATVDKLEKEMELITIEKEEALEASPLPVKGFTVTEQGIMLTNHEGHLVPFCQASTAQQLRVALAIAMSANPDLRVIRIADGSLLDDNSLKIIEEMAGKEDFQIWIEYSSRNDKDRIGIYIEDGSIV
jgi:DNA repair exonuclease SbcCD ATPase subunit